MTSMIDLDLDAIFEAEEPCRALARERERGWLARSAFGLHVLSFDAAFDLLRDRRFHPDVMGTLDGAGVTDPVVRKLWSTALLGSVPVDHDRLRKLVAPYFTRRAVTELRGFVEQRTDELVDGIGDGPVDVVTALTSRIPPAVFAEMIGASSTDVDKIGRWSTTILQVFARQPETGPSVEAAAHELLDYVDAFIARRRDEPGDGDMISALLAAEDDGERLSTDELRAIVLEALEASTDNTASSLATLLYAGALHPEQWERLRHEPARIPAYVEEVARLWPRVVHISRSPATDVEWRGLEVSAGTELLISVPAALRDPDVFAEPDRFDLERDCPTSYNLNYGSGGHHCIGAALARMEMTTVLEVLTRRWESLRLTGEHRITSNVGVTTVERLELDITTSI